MQLKVLRKDDGYWLSIEGQKMALINLGNHGEIVTAALEEAAQQSAQDEKHCPHCDVNGIFDGCCINCGVPDDES